MLVLLVRFKVAIFGKISPFQQILFGIDKSKNDADFCIFCVVAAKISLRTIHSIVGG